MSTSTTENHNINSKSNPQNGDSPATNGNNISANDHSDHKQLALSSFEVDIVRLIGQHLMDRGYTQSFNELMRESGLGTLDNPLIIEFQQSILLGDWTHACFLVEKLANHSTGTDKEADMKKMKLLIAEQKFLELIDDNQPIEALECLQKEITPYIFHDVKKITYLTKLLLCRSVEELRLKSNWPGKGPASRRDLIEKFQHFISTSMMLPRERLNTLLYQACELQKERCSLHIPDSISSDDSKARISSSTDQHIDLKTDHICSSGKFPMQCVQALENHKNEIWYCKFSNDGTKLATGGLCGQVKIWDVDPQLKKLSERCTLDCNSYSITCLSWSPDDVYLLTCGTEDRHDFIIWDVNKEKEYQRIRLENDESATTCSWHPSGEKFATASTRGNFHIYGIDGSKIGSREGVRVRCLSFLHKDPSVVLASDSLNRIKSYAVKDMSLETDEEDILREQYPIMSFTIDREDQHIAVNIMEQGIHLWDLKTRTLLKMFSGVSQRNFTIHSCFSSPQPYFLASGSEDGKIYIYHVHKDKLVAILHGHSRVVNCVTWNPRFPELLVSVSDDRFVRLWAPRQITNQ